MPILAATDLPKKRRAPVRALILAVVVLPLVGLFGWGWYQPVWVVYHWRGVAFGRTTETFWSRFVVYAPRY
jgi:hypothetical protein